MKKIINSNIRAVQSQMILVILLFSGLFLLPGISWSGYTESTDSMGSWRGGKIMCSRCNWFFGWSTSGQYSREDALRAFAEHDQKDHNPGGGTQGSGSSSSASSSDPFGIGNLLKAITPADNNKICGDPVFDPTDPGFLRYYSCKEDLERENRKKAAEAAAARAEENERQREINRRQQQQQRADEEKARKEQEYRQKLAYEQYKKDLELQQRRQEKLDRFLVSITPKDIRLKSEYEKLLCSAGFSYMASQASSPETAAMYAQWGQDAMEGRVANLGCMDSLPNMPGITKDQLQPDRIEKYKTAMKTHQKQAVEIEQKKTEKFNMLDELAKIRKERDEIQKAVTELENVKIVEEEPQSAENAAKPPVQIVDKQKKQNFLEKVRKIKEESEKRLKEAEEKAKLIEQELADKEKEFEKTRLELRNVK